MLVYVSLLEINRYYLQNNYTKNKHQDDVNQFLSFSESITVANRLATRIYLIIIYVICIQSTFSIKKNKIKCIC
jgi:hypothetical protein